jgi:ribosomal protein S18 acetylase RimI-like enzyme
MQTAMNIRRYSESDLPGVLALCRAEGWPSLIENPLRANRVLTAPGVTTMVAHEEGTVIGFAQIQSDGEIQAHLSLIAIHADHRRRGVARALIEAGLKQAGGLRLDLITDSAPDFYATLPHVRMTGFRLYPNYTGPDRYEPGLEWRDGRKVKKA